MHPLIQSVVQSQEKNWPQFRPGDQLKVWVKITDVGGERTQAFEGIVIRVRGKGASGNFTVRKVSFGIGIERTFPFNSPHIDKLEVLKSSQVRRARLYYLRQLSGKEARPEEKESFGGSAEAPAKGLSQPPAEKSGSGAKPKLEAAQSQSR